MPLRSAQELVAEAKKSVPCCSAEEAVARMRSGNVLVLDVREPEEHARRALPGAVNLPRGLLEFRIAEIVGDAAHPILVHCASGGRAVLAARTLREMGYQDVTAIDCPVDALCQTLEGSAA